MNRIRTVNNETIQLKVSDNDVVDYANQLILEVSIFLEEYNRYWIQKSESEFRSRIDQVRNICSPIMKRLQQWPDIQHFRNRFVAHNWRDKTGKFVVPDLNEYRIPRNAFEYHMMADFIRYMYSIIKFHFKSEFDLMIKYMYSQFVPNKKIADYTELNDQLASMAEEVNKRARNFDSTFILKVFLYEYEK